MGVNEIGGISVSYDFQYTEMDIDASIHLIVSICVYVNKDTFPSSIR